MKEKESSIKNKQILVGADFAGFPLKEAVVAHLQAKGWEVTDVGVRADSDPEDTDLMFHRVGLRAGAMISEGEFERALLFCGTGMGIHIAASKCPHVHAGVVESVPAALRAITGNGVNVLAMGAFLSSASFTMCISFSRVLSLPTFVALISTAPKRLTVPQKSSSPTALSTGSDSPVTTD